ncbi:elongation factor P [bacterium Unc6]|nr:elongation factor P [bacterium Unc6]
MVSTEQFKNGLTFKLEGKVVRLIEFQHVKPGKGAAFVRTKLRIIKTGFVLERTFDGGTKFEDAYIQEKELQYLYKDGDTFYFMDQQTFEQVELSSEEVKRAANYIIENMNISASFCDGALLEVSPPMFVELVVTETEPGVRGDTAKGGTKSAKLESGAVVQVPLFVEKGDKIKVDTRTGTYVSRV